MATLESNIHLTDADIARVNVEFKRIDNNLFQLTIGAIDGRSPLNSYDLKDYEDKNLNIDNSHPDTIIKGNLTALFTFINLLKIDNPDAAKPILTLLDKLENTISSSQRNPVSETKKKLIPTLLSSLRIKSSNKTVEKATADAESDSEGDGNSSHIIHTN